MYNCAHLRLNNKKNKNTIFLGWKFFWSKICLAENFLGENFWVKIFLGIKIFLGEYFLCENFCTKIFCLKIFCVKIFLVKNFLGENFLGEFFLW